MHFDEFDSIMLPSFRSSISTVHTEEERGETTLRHANSESKRSIEAQCHARRRREEENYIGPKNLYIKFNSAYIKILIAEATR